MNLTVDPRIKLRPLSLDDAPALADAVLNHYDYMVEWMMFPVIIEDEEEAIKYINFSCSEFSQPYEQEYTILYDDLFAGIVKVMQRRNEPDKKVLGAWLEYSHQGKGIMVRTLGKVIDYFFQNTDIKIIEIQVSMSNTRSQKLPERLGFTFSHISYRKLCGKLDLYNSLHVYYKYRPQ